MLLVARAALAGRPAVAAPTALTALRQLPRARHALALRSPCAGLLRTSPRASGQGLSHAVAPLFAKSYRHPLLVSYWPLARTTPCDVSPGRGSLPYASGESSFSASDARPRQATPQIVGLALLFRRLPRRRGARVGCKESLRTTRRIRRSFPAARRQLGRVGCPSL